MSRDGRKAFEWGLASLTLGATLTVTGAVAMTASEEAGSFWNRTPDWDWFAPLLLAVPAGFSLLSFVGAATGLRAAFLARTSSRPVALGVVGSVLCLSAAVLWAVSTGSWYTSLEYFGAFGGTGTAPPSASSGPGRGFF